MDIKLKNSIDRAITLLKTSADYEKYILVKISPTSGCCCSHCLPETWQEINKAISPCGPVKHEGDALIEKDGNIFVLEQHESGPEIIIYALLMTPPCIEAVISLTERIIKAFSKNNGKKSGQLCNIQIKQIVIAKNKETRITEIDIPPSNEMSQQIEKILTQVIKKNLGN